MKIKTDFVTNSSSTSFIVGSPGYISDTVDTVYNLSRMVIHEMYYIIDGVKNDIRNNKLFIDFKYVLTLSIYDPNYHLLYRNYSKNKFINDLFIKYYNNSIFSVCVKNFEDDIINLLKIELAEPTLEYEYILNNSTYNQYRENSTSLELLNLSEVEEKYNLKSYLKASAYDYFVEHENIEAYNEFLKKIELMNDTDIKEFILNKLGSVFVSIKDDDYGSYFEYILQSFFSR